MINLYIETENKAGMEITRLSFRLAACLISLGYLFNTTSTP